MTLKLKSGVTFTDGSKLTAQLVKENLDRRSNAKLQSYGAFAKGGADQITSVTAPDASTVVLTFAAPQATFQTNLAGEPGMIVGQHGISDPAGLQTTPDGSGPYKLSSAVKGSSYTVTREARRRRRDLPVRARSSTSRSSTSRRGPTPRSPGRPTCPSSTRPRRRWPSPTACRWPRTAARSRRC